MSGFTKVDPCSLNAQHLCRECPLHHTLDSQNEEMFTLIHDLGASFPRSGGRISLGLK